MAKRFGVILGLALLVVCASGVLEARASTIDILWYTGGIVNSLPDYKASYNALAASSPGGNTWIITYRDSGALPVGTFNTLVVASQIGFWSTFPDYIALTSAGLTEDSFGNRVMVTGQDTSPPVDGHGYLEVGPDQRGGGQLYRHLGESGRRVVRQVVLTSRQPPGPLDGRR